MDLRALNHFLTLAETLHYGRASQQCHLSTSALSRSILRLEQNVGVELFTRDNRQVSLTPAGEQFRRFARDTLDHWEQIRSSLEQDKTTLRGELSVYCSVTASYSFLYQILEAFRSAHPEVEIRLRTGDPEHAIHRVLTNQEDITIAARPDKLASGLAFLPIGSSTLKLIAPKHNPELIAQARCHGSETSWSEAPMILSEQGVARHRVDSWFEQHGQRPNIYAQAAGNEAIVSMVSLGFGIGVVPDIVLENSPLKDQVVVIPANPVFGDYDIGLFALEKKLSRPIIEAFWNLTNSKKR